VLPCQCAPLNSLQAIKLLNPSEADSEVYLRSGLDYNNHPKYPGGFFIGVGMKLSVPDLNVITVVDPFGDEEVDLRPQELLEIVLIGNKEPIWWFENQMIPGVRLKGLRNETLFVDGFDRYREGNFRVQAHSDNWGYQQNHFWFGIDSDSCKNVQELARNYYPMAVISFREKNNNEIVGRLKVNLCIEKEDKEEYFSLMERTILTGKDVIAHEAQISGLSDSITDEANGYILNPDSEEQVELDKSQQMALVELVQPPHAKVKWKIKSCSSRNDGEVCFSVSEMTPRHINGIPVQRFLIKSQTQYMPMGMTRMRLGNVTFGFTGDVRWNRTINFFVVNERQVVEEPFFGGEGDDYDEEATFRFLHQMTEASTVEQKPRKVPVKIEELDVKGDLRAGAKLLQVYLPKPEKKKILEFADLQDNAVITYPNDGRELVIQLYKDLTAVPLGTGDWIVEYSGSLVHKYSIGDCHRQRFFFNYADKPGSFESLTFRMRGRTKRIHVILENNVVENNVVQEIKVEDRNIEKVLSELIDHKLYDWLTTSTIAFETRLSEIEVKRILDSEFKEGRVRKHPTDKGLWGASSRVDKFLAKYVPGFCKNPVPCLGSSVDCIA
jgi:hypothetical protein